MNVYFTGSLSEADKADILNYLSIVNLLKKKKCRITNHFFEDILSGKKKNNGKDKEIYEKLISKISISDCVVAEITAPSISLGIQIEYALNHKIPVLCLISNESNNNIPLAIRDHNNKLLKRERYNNIFDISTILDDFLVNYPKSILKFNMFINQELDEYLSFLSKQAKTSKAEVLRKFLQEKMSKDKSFGKKNK